MASSDIQIVSNENGEPTGVIVPIELWREIESERETAYLLRSDVMKTRRLAAMKRSFAATVSREGNWYVSQCLEVDVASQGETEEEALSNLKEALELHFEPPCATRPPAVRTVEVELGRLKPQPFREIKRRLEAAGFAESSQNGRHVNS